MAKEYWRRGIGVECAQAWLKFGFEKCGLERIVAVALPDNVGSWRIMEKCGMTFEKNVENYGMNLVLYAISKDEFLRRTGK
jgi:ribosomal-protein-alanine N-acetyltransferase